MREPDSVTSARQFELDEELNRHRQHNCKFAKTYADGYAAGQRDMKERAALEAEQDEEYGFGIAVEIRALPINPVPVEG